MQLNSKSILSLMLLSASIMSCDKKEDEEEKETPTLVISSTYDATTFNSHPVKAGVDGLLAVESELPGNRPSKTVTGTIEITASELKADYSVGNPSSLDMASVSFKANLENVIFPGYQKNSKATSDGDTINWNDLSASPNGGGSGYIFNSDGVEVEQIMVKGGFAGIAFHYTKNVLFSDLENVTLGQLDAALNLYGSDPTFENAKQSAKYGNKREKDGTKFHVLISNEFRKAQSAIKQDIKTEKVAAINQIMLLWEEALAAQVIYYAFDVVDYFSKSTLTTTDKSKGCHAWSEAVGIIHSFYSVTGKKNN